MSRYNSCELLYEVVGGCPVVGESALSSLTIFGQFG